MNRYIFHTAYQTVIHTEYQVPSAAQTQLFLLMMGSFLRGLSPHANYTDRAAAAGRRS